MSANPVRPKRSGSTSRETPRGGQASSSQRNIQNLDKSRVLVSMSGGMESTVAAALLKNQGYTVFGVYFQLIAPQDRGRPAELRGHKPFPSRCCARDRTEEVEALCKKLGIHFSVKPLHEEFAAEVADYCVHEFLSCRLPNPCAKCNSSIRFKGLVEFADELNCYWVATGHYAQVNHDEESPEGNEDRKEEEKEGRSRTVGTLYQAVDHENDQTYLLYALQKEWLGRTLMPIGGLQKRMVLRLAKDLKLEDLSSDSDSRQVCFVQHPDRIKYIEDRSPAHLRDRGVLRGTDGVVLGVHGGVHRFSVGQEHGLQISLKNAGRYFVTGFDPRNEAVEVGPEIDLYRREVRVHQLHWIEQVDGLRALRCSAKASYKEEMASARVTLFEANRAKVIYDQPYRALAPGSPIVFYRGKQVLGGGLIEEVLDPPNSEINPSFVIGDPLKVRKRGPSQSDSEI